MSSVDYAQCVLWASLRNCEKRRLVASVMSVRPYQPGSHWTDFREILHLEVFMKIR
jgi:hypothetical protein